MPASHPACPVSTCDGDGRTVPPSDRHTCTREAWSAAVAEGATA